MLVKSGSSLTRLLMTGNYNLRSLIQFTHSPSDQTRFCREINREGVVSTGALPLPLLPLPCTARSGARARVSMIYARRADQRAWRATHTTKMARSVRNAEATYAQERGSPGSRGVTTSEQPRESLLLSFCPASLCAAKSFAHAMNSSVNRSRASDHRFIAPIAA